MTLGILEFEMIRIQRFYYLTKNKKIFGRPRGLWLRQAPSLVWASKLPPKNNMEDDFYLKILGGGHQSKAPYDGAVMAFKWFSSEMLIEIGKIGKVNMKKDNSRHEQDWSVHLYKC